MSESNYNEDKATAALQAIFGPPWTEATLALALALHDGNIQDTAKAIIESENENPEVVLREIHTKVRGASEADIEEGPNVSSAAARASVTTAARTSIGSREKRKGPRRHLLGGHLGREGVEAEEEGQNPHVSLAREAHDTVVNQTISLPRTMANCSNVEELPIREEVEQLPGRRMHTLPLGDVRRSEDSLPPHVTSAIAEETEAVKNKRMSLGLCPSCGAQLFDIRSGGTFGREKKLVPINKARVSYHGICLVCHPQFSQDENIATATPRNEGVLFTRSDQEQGSDTTQNFLKQHRCKLEIGVLLTMLVIIICLSTLGNFEKDQACASEAKSLKHSIEPTPFYTSLSPSLFTEGPTASPQPSINSSTSPISSSQPSDELVPSIEPTSACRAFLIDDFDPDVDPDMWSKIENGIANTNCNQTDPTDKSLFFTGTGTRAAVFTGQIQKGAIVRFDLLLGSSSTACAEAFDAGEEVIFEFLPRGSADFVAAATFQGGSYNSFTSVHVPLEGCNACNGSARGFRIHQPSHSGGNADQWAMDNIGIICSSDWV